MKVTFSCNLRGVIGSEVAILTLVSHDEDEKKIPSVAQQEKCLPFADVETNLLEKSSHSTDKVCADFDPNF